MSAERWESERQPGMPADRRLASKRLRDADSTLGDFEFSAARVVARYLGERVELIDDGSSDALVDGRIVYDDRPAGVFEVVTDTDPKWAATYDAIRRRGFEVRTETLRRRWQAHLGRSCNLRTLEAQAPALLAQLESAGLLFDRYRELDDLTRAGDVAIEQLARLGITSLSSRSLLFVETCWTRAQLAEARQGKIDLTEFTASNVVTEFVAPRGIEDVTAK